MSGKIFSRGSKIVWTIVWTSFLGGVPFRLIFYLGSREDLVPGLKPYVYIAGLVSLLSLVLVIYGCFLVLRSKNRPWTWIFCLLLDLLGVFIILGLKDKSPSPSSAQLPVRKTSTDAVR
jgi:drug/metabolite transporter (DMT)-like permease